MVIGTALQSAPATKGAALNGNARSLADLVLRWFLGLILATAGAYKILGMGLSGFAGYIGGTFAVTPLPGFFLTVFAWVLPFAELVLGLLLLAGWRRRAVQTAAGITFVLLAGGQFMLGYAESLAGNGQAAGTAFGTAARNGIYVLAAVLALMNDGPPLLAVDGRTPDAE